VFNQPNSLSLREMYVVANKLLTTAASTANAELAFQVMGSAIKAINDVNCTHVPVNASDCSSIGRQDCGTGDAPPDNTCGMCLDGYVGPYGYSNSLHCNRTTAADRRRLELEDHLRPFGKKGALLKRESRKLGADFAESYTDGARSDVGKHGDVCKDNR
jgi:hypothetical protein